MRSILGCFAMALAFVVAPCVARPHAARLIVTAADRRGAPDFTLPDTNGTRVSLTDYRGQVVVLDFWATWCTGCKVEIPWFMEFHEKYNAEGLVTIGVAMDEEGWTPVREYLKEHPINYRIVTGYPDLMKPYEVTSLPVTLLIDRAGRIADAHVGVVDKEAWEEEIQTLLREAGK
jgi:peroxiredoxin